MEIPGGERGQCVKNDQREIMKDLITIYIVEDELLIAACLKDQLLYSGYHVLGTSTRGEKSIQAIRDLKDKGKEPQVVLMDIHLRGSIDGVETARLISEEFQCAIIFLTGQSSKEVYDRSFHIKPFGYILKPYDLDQMIMTIEIAAYQRKLEIENREIRRELERLLNEKIRENTEMLELYDTITENTLTGIWVVHNDKVVFANRAIASMFGYTPEEFRAFNYRDLTGLLHPDDRSRLLELAQQKPANENIPQQTLFRIFRKDGEIRWMKTFIRRIRFRDRTSLHQTFLDVTEYMNCTPNKLTANHEKK